LNWPRDRGAILLWADVLDRDGRQGWAETEAQLLVTPAGAADSNPAMLRIETGRFKSGI
jgi:hypothetical protein